MKITWNVPNILTLIRFVLIGVFVYLFAVPANYVAAVIVFVVAFLTDVLDGYIARKYHMVTDFGKLMDPLADKLMLIAALCCLTFSGMLHPAFLIFELVKELGMICGAGLLYKKNVVVYARIWGKLATFFFNAGVVLTFLVNFFEKIYPWNMVVLGIAALLAVIAAAQYLHTFLENRKGAKAASRGADIRKD